MRMRILMLTLVLLCAAALCSAADHATAAGAGKQIIGTIDHLDVSTKTITLKIMEDGKEHSAAYTYSDKSEFTDGSKTLMPENLAVGSRVKVTADANRVITKLQLEGPKTEPSN